jgi:micrococcal nuclease
MKLIAAIFLLGFISGVAVANEEFRGKVSRVIDGNTIEISTTQGKTYKVLMFGIDSPEMGQEYAEQAKTLLEALLLHKSVLILIHGKDRTGNRLGVIQIEGGIDPRHELIKAGLAWTAEREPIAELEMLREQAQAEGRGLWKEENPTPPWKYRQLQSMTLSKSS